MGVEGFFDYPDEDAASTSTLEQQAGPVLGSSWAPERWAALLAHTETLRLRPGEHLIRLGEAERALYILEAGQLEAVVAARRGERRFPMTEGTVIGEVAFFDGRARSADVVAVTECQVRRLSADAVETMSARHPELGRALLMDLGVLLAHRLRRAEALARA